MNNYVFNDVAEVEYDGTLLKYTLCDSEKYYDTAYRILKKDKSGYFMNCNKMLFNGKIQFLFKIADLTSLAGIANQLTSLQCVNVINVIINEIKKVSEMGFIQMNTIDLDLNRIFYNSNDGRVMFICVPVTDDSSQELSSRFNVNLCNLIAEFIKMTNYMNDRALSNIYNSCVNGELSKEFKGQAHNNANSITLACVNADIPPFYITKEEFLIGKSIDCDGVLSISQAVSRKHCKILLSYEGFKIEDVGSSNGTFVNGMRLNMGQQYFIKSGDKVRIANIEFEIR